MFILLVLTRDHFLLFSCHENSFQAVLHSKGKMFVKLAEHALSAGRCLELVVNQGYTGVAASNCGEKQIIACLKGRGKI